MKKYLIIIYLINCISNHSLLLGVGSYEGASMTNKNLVAELPVINIPEIQGVQTIKSLIRIKPHDKDKSLALVNSQLRYLPLNNSDNSQLWWIIQDYKYHAFALANASDTDQWMYFDPSKNRMSVIKNDRRDLNDPLLGEYIEKQYFFEFEVFDTENSYYLIRSRHSKPYYLETTNLHSTYSDWRLGIKRITSDCHSMYFDIEVFEENLSDMFIYLPMSKTDNHTQWKKNNSLKIYSNRLIIDNKAYLSSSYGFLTNRLGAENMFKITFDNLVTRSVVGLLHYKSVPFSNSFYQKEGNRKPIAGISVKGDAIFLFNKDNVVPTSFKKGIPIIFGYENGELIAKQNDIVESIGGVATPTLLNSTNGNKIKLFMYLPYGGIRIAYNPKTILFGHNFFKGKDSTKVIMTNPYLSALKNPEKHSDVFDWTTKTYKLRYEDPNGWVLNEEEVLSPFYYDQEEFSAIAANYSPDGQYTAGEDFEYYDGWELIVHDFGYDRMGDEKPSSQLRNEPYMILYNRYTSKLRIFVYMSNHTIANNLKISLSDGPRTGVIEKHQTARLWGSYLQGRALDDPDLSTEEYSKTIRLNSTGKRFYFADFTLSYDPCVVDYESNLRLAISKVTRGDLEIVGRTKGGVIPVNSPAISDWLQNSNHYLTGILNNPYGKLKTTLGDITFRNFNQWGKEEWKNTASFVLPGKKVEAWEKEAARLELEGQDIISSGEFLSGAGLLLIGTTQLATAADITHVSTSIGEGIGSIMDGMGTIMSASGSALIAKSLKLQYENLKDEPDRNITVDLPDPQPSVVFSELAAKGSLSIETLVFDNVIITTPGSKYSELAPDHYMNKSKGSYPIYNEPLGVFNLLYQPKVALSIVKQSKDIGGYIRLKERPYLAVNNAIDYLGGFFMINYVVTTYDSSGYSTQSNRSKPYLFADRNISGVKILPTSLDISDLLDKKTLLKNITQYINDGGNDIENKINDWVTVQLEIELFGYTGKDNNGMYGVSDLSNSYKAHQVSSYEDATGVDEDISSLLIDFSDLSYGNDYLGDDVELWGENYLVGSSTDQHTKKMKEYCIGDSESEIRKRSKVSWVDNENLEPKNLSSVDVSKLEEKGGILVYPNPSNGIFTIHYVPKETGKVTLRIYDSNGNVLVTHADHTSSTHLTKKAKINISYLRSGVYILEIRHKSGEKYTKKLIKN